MRNQQYVEKEGVKMKRETFGLLVLSFVLSLTLALQVQAQVDGSGTPDFIPKWTGPTTLGDSVIVETGGNVGIGTTAPGFSLEVIGPSDNQTAVFRSDPDPTNPFVNQLALIGSGPNSEARLGFVTTHADGVTHHMGIIKSVETPEAGGDLVFETREPGLLSIPERMRITAGGNVGIGTTNPFQKLHVEGLFPQVRLSTPDFIVSHAEIGVALDNFVIRVLGRDTLIISDGFAGLGLPSAQISHRLTLPNVNSPSGRGLANGWFLYSSRRWKTNIQTIQGAVEKVERLRGVSFDWKENGGHDIGLIAEEVGEVVPEVVAYEENGKDARSLDYARLTALLIEAVKEQQSQIRELKAEVEGLKAKQTGGRKIAMSASPLDGEASPAGTR
jgi:hypothetical protein